MLIYVHTLNVIGVEKESFSVNSRKAGVSISEENLNRKLGLRWGVAASVTWPPARKKPRITW